MAASPRFRAPAGDGEVLAVPDFASVPALVAENRRRLDRTDVVIGGLPLRELRALARREVIELANGPASAGRDDSPLILAGHQPELSHPGVWVKHFALNGLARKVGGTPLNLVVDNDTLKSTALRFPVFQDRNPASVHIESLRYDTFSGDVPYEDRRVEDAEHTCLFDSFADRSMPLWENWGYEPLLPWVWPDVVHQNPNSLIGERFAAVRQQYEREWGCDNLELPVSRLSQTEAFRRFAAHLVHDPQFPHAYNSAVRDYRHIYGIRSANHPVPDLQTETEGLSDGGGYETPFWVVSRRGPRRGRLFTDSRMNRSWYWADDWETGPGWNDVAPTLRPRALTLTLFARVCLGDFFIHGIGGGKYDEVTDHIIRDYFGIDPPAYQVLSATLHLPLPGFPATAADVERAERRVRDLYWNPHRHLSELNTNRPEVHTLVGERAALVAAEPPHGNHAARREWFEALQTMAERLRPFVWKQVAPAKAALARAKVEAAANAVLRRRDYSWVLYPEATLRPFLQRFLDVP